MAKNELQNAIIQNLASAPGTPAEGQVYEDTTAHKLYYYNGTTWIAADGSSLIDTDGTLTANSDLKVASQKATKTYADTKLGATAAAAGDLSGNYPNPGVAKIGGVAVTVDTDAALAANSDAKIATQKATKAYVDGKIQGVTWKAPVQNATTSALPTYTQAGSGVGATLTESVNGVLVAIDGVTNVVGDRLLVKNETAGNAPFNGIYTVTNVGSAGTKWVLTRATDFDQAGEIAGSAVLSEGGTTNVNQGYVIDSNVAYTVDTTAIAFVQFTGVSDITAGTGIVKSGNQISIDTAWPGQAAITTVGTISTGTWGSGATNIAVNAGGTGASTAAGARTNLAATGKYTNAANPNATTWTVTHSLGTTAVVVAVFLTSSGAEVMVDVVRTDANTVTLTFAVAPAINTYTCVVVG